MKNLFPIFIVLIFSGEGLVIANDGELQENRSTERIELNLSHVEVPGLSQRDGTGVYDQLVRKACVKANIKCKFFFFEANGRALIEADNGHLDGTYPRVSSIESRFSNLMMVPESLGVRHFAAFALYSESLTIDWATACHSRPGFIRGWQRLHQEFKDCPQAIVATDPQSLFQMLGQEKIGMAVYTLESGRHVLKAKNLSSIQILKPFLDTQLVYVYLNREVSFLKKRFAAALLQEKELR